MKGEEKKGWSQWIKITKEQRPFIFKLATIAFVGIVVLSFANMFNPAPRSGGTEGIRENIGNGSSGGNWDGGDSPQGPAAGLFDNNGENKSSLESRLEKVLGEIDGAGRVSVTVIFSEGSTREFAVNVSTTVKEVEEKDQAGGNRTTCEKTENGQVVMQGNEQQPVVVKESMPKIQGVLVVAQGAENPLIKERLFLAVQSLLQVPAHRINVCSMNGG